MSQIKPNNPKIKFVTKYSKDYSVFPVTGIYGGFTAEALLTVNLFADNRLMPSAESFEMDKIGKLKPDTRIEEYDENTVGNSDVEKTVLIDRTVFGTMMLQPNNAFTIAKWIIRRMIEAKRINVIHFEEDNIKQELLGLFEDKDTSKKEKGEAVLKEKKEV